MIEWLGRTPHGWDRRRGRPSRWQKGNSPRVRRWMLSGSGPPPSAATPPPRVAGPASPVTRRVHPAARSARAVIDRSASDAYRLPGVNDRPVDELRRAARVGEHRSSAGGREAIADGFDAAATIVDSVPDRKAATAFVNLVAAARGQATMSEGRVDRLPPEFPTVLELSPGSQPSWCIEMGATFPNSGATPGRSSLTRITSLVTGSNPTSDGRARPCAGITSSRERH